MLFILKHKKKILIFLAMLTILLGTKGFYLEQIPLDKGDSIHLFKIVNNTLGLFIFEWVDHDEILIDYATFLGMLTTFFGILVIFFTNISNRWYIYWIQRKKYNLVIGLSEQNRNLLEDFDRDTPVIIIEKDKNNKYLKSYRERGFGIKEIDAEDAMKELNFDEMKRCIISTNNDRRNIALGKDIINKLNSKKKQTIYICISNRDLSVLFKQAVISSDKSKNVDVITYSLYENMAKRLFFEHSILGEQYQIIHSQEDYNIILVGDSTLAVEIVYHLSFLSALPNQNTLTLHLVHADAKRFRNRLKKLFPYIDKIEHLTIRTVDVSSEDFEFYNNEIWKSRNLTNIIIATQDEEKNLDIAINLQDTTYVQDIGHNRFNTKVLFALYHNLGLGEEINRDRKAFANFYTFGNIADTSSIEILLDTKLDLVAKLIHSSYTGDGEVDKDKLYRDWLDISPHQRDSNKTQALHIDIKLLAFGLKRVKSDKSPEKLLKINKKVLHSHFNSKKIEQELKDYHESYFPSSLDKRLFDRVARSEHNRWSAFHYLNGWQYNNKRNDNAKEHNCLQVLECFIDKSYYQYNIASVYYIPNYLAYAGYEVMDS
jgi:hypothetical protein